MSTIHDIVNWASSTVVNTGVSAGVGYLCARAFMSINPVHGAVVAAVSCVVSRVADPIFTAIFGGDKANMASKFVGTVLNITASVGGTLAIASALGFPVTLYSFACLTAIMTAASLITAIALTAILGTAAYVADRSVA